MSEPTPTIPPALLEAATFGVLRHEGHEDIDSDFLVDFPRCADAAKGKAQAALEAALPALLEQIAELESKLKMHQIIYTRTDNDVATVNALLDGSRQANDTLKEQIADYNEAYRRVMAEQCAPDERHCACVPALRARVDELETESRYLKGIYGESFKCGHATRFIWSSLDGKRRACAVCRMFAAEQIEAELETARKGIHAAWLKLEPEAHPVADDLEELLKES